MTKKINNLVAKYAHLYNRTVVVPDKKKVYKRKEKHSLLRDYSNLLFV